MADSVFDKFCRGVTLSDVELIQLEKSLGLLQERLLEINSQRFELVVSGNQQYINELVKERKSRNIGYYVTEYKTTAACIKHGKVYVRVIDKDENWVPVMAVPEEIGELVPIAERIAYSMQAPVDDHFFSCYKSHYDYMDEVLPLFWPRVFGKTLEATGCCGIVGAHGDKAYQYRDQWKALGVPFYHGVLLYMLTYTSQQTRPKHQSDWSVVEFYHTYRDLILEIEKDLKGL